MYHVGTHAEETHGMTEMAVADFGQYAHSCQATHGILWHYALAGRPDKTERLTRRVLDELYGPGVDGFCGDEDTGELGAWYVWAALGLYPLCPGSSDYVLGSPLFSSVEVDSGDGRRLVIDAPGNGPETPLVRRRTLANVTLSDARVSQADLFDLGRLVCEMAPVQPNERG
jgi:putative alpha-1,2-mannosidase